MKYTNLNNLFIKELKFFKLQKKIKSTAHISNSDLRKHSNRYFFSILYNESRLMKIYFYS